MIDRVQDSMVEHWAKEYRIPENEMRQIAGIVATQVIIEIRRESGESCNFEAFLRKAFEISKNEIVKPLDYKQ